MNFRKNVLDAWRQVNLIDLDRGVKAYPTYHHTLRGLASYYNTPFVATVEAFVALSPNNDYHGNLRSLVSLLRAWENRDDFSSCTISTYRACGERAWGYLSGEVSFLDTVKGRKITSFRDNILYLDDSRKVTVDGHMVCIAHGRRMTMTEANLALRHKGTYDHTERAVLTLAKRELIAPCAVQATLWTWRKRTLGIKMDTQQDLFTGTTKWDGVIAPEDIKPYGA